MTRIALKREASIVVEGVSEDTIHVAISSPTMGSGGNMQHSFDSADVLMKDAPLFSANGLPTPSSTANGIAVDEPLFLQRRGATAAGKSSPLSVVR
jgi:hypothetical protein